MKEPVDIVAPISRTASFIAFTNELEASSGVRMVSHAGDGDVHLCVVREDRDGSTWERELHAVMDRAYHKAYELGGRGLRGARHRRGQAALLPPGGRENLAVMNQIKDAMDPLHILNDKKSYIGVKTHAEPF